MNDLEVYEIGMCEGAACIKEMADSGVSVPLAVTGSSMMPLLKPGRDIVWLEPCDKGSVKRGTILLFERADGTLVLHRARKIRNGRLLMNGDALSWSETVEFVQIIACVNKIERNGKMLDCNSLQMKLRDAFWYPTRPFRPFLKKIRVLTEKRGD